MREDLQARIEKIIHSPVPVRPSLFQLRFFAIGKEPTHQAKLKRCVEEIRSRKRDIDNAIDEIAELTDKKQLLLLDLEAEVEVLGDDPRAEIKARMGRRKAGAIDRQIFEIQLVLQARIEECEFLVALYEDLTRKQPQLNWDDSDVQLEYWEAKLGGDMQQRLELKAPQDLEVIRTVLALPSKSQLRASLAAICGSNQQPQKVVPAVLQT